MYKIHKEKKPLGQVLIVLQKKTLSGRNHRLGRQAQPRDSMPELHQKEVAYQWLMIPKTLLEIDIFLLPELNDLETLHIRPTKIFFLAHLITIQVSTNQQTALSMVHLCHDITTVNFRIRLFTRSLGISWLRFTSLNMLRTSRTKRDQALPFTDMRLSMQVFKRKEA